jgi:hypothetical protein
VKPRLHVLLARDAPTAVVFRRGPARAVACVGWDRTRDTFALGQWLRGRIYERRADLSPDGQHLIYFAMNGHWGSRAKGAWTAISRPPYLHAVTLLAKGDCWHGGGLFVDNRHYWLNDGYGHEVLEDTGEVTRAAPPPYAPTWGGEDWGVYFHRLLRDGWTMRPELSPAPLPQAHTVVFERPLVHGWILRRLAHAQVGAPQGKGVYHDAHELVHPASGRERMRHDWEWAELDGDRLVWATDGALWAGELTKRSAAADDPVTSVRMLHDFAPMTFEAVAAPYARATTPTRAARPVVPAPPRKPRARRGR